MISIEKAYRIANSFFVENDYVGVYEVRENEDSWLFVPQCKSACYGVANVCVPKNGDEPYVFSTTDADGAVMWERGFYNNEIVQPDILEYLMLIRWIGRTFLGCGYDKKYYVN